MENLYKSFVIGSVSEMVLGIIKEYKPLFFSTKTKIFRENKDGLMFIFIYFKGLKALKTFHLQLSVSNMVL